MHETTRHRIAFNCYWALGPSRSIERLQALLAAEGADYGFARPPDLRTLYRWSSALGWQAQLEALERQARARDQAAQLAAISEMNARQAQEGLLLQEKAIAGLQAREPGDFSPAGLIRALESGARLERLARGEPTDRAETIMAGDPRLERLTDDELDTLLERLDDEPPSPPAVGGEGEPESGG